MRSAMLWKRRSRAWLVRLCGPSACSARSGSPLRRTFRPNGSFFRLYLEQARVFDLRGPAGNVVGAGRPPGVVVTDDLGRFALVDPLCLLEEASVGVRVHVHVPEQRE